MRKLVILFSLVFAIAQLQWSAPSVDAQGWRLFSNKIKEEALEKKGKAPQEGADGAQEGEEQEELPPLFDVTRKDREQAQSQAPAPQEEEEEAAPQRGVRSAVSNGGLLDFSDALVNDAAETLGDADNEPRLYNESRFAENPPSYRNFPEQQNDARLNDVCFVDETRGWAVGDRGVIWQTANGGETWTRAESPTDANLFAVSFLDQNYGLAVGGRVLPSVQVGQGVILRTVDGGQTWGEVATASFPILRDVRILDAENAWIAGDSSNLYPSGLFFSADTGVEWTPVDGTRSGGWQAALYDPIERLGLGVTPLGEVQRISGPESERAALSLGVRRVEDVAYDGTTNCAWLVGDQGLALFSSDFGASWSQTPGGFPNEAQFYFDLNAVVAKDGFVGAAGSPGSVFFYTDDGGITWNAAATGIKTPLRKMTFVNRSVGWAVGDLGVIIATRDGGRTWRVQRRGAERVALLGVFGRANEAPLEAFTQLAGDEGFVTEIALVAREAEKEGVADEIPYAERFNEALVETGVSGSTQVGLFILNPPEQRDSIEQILKRFDAENDGDGLARFRERLVRLIRTWRPSCLLTSDSVRDGGGVGKLPDSLDLSNSGDAQRLIGALVEDSSRLDERPRDAFQELLLRELPGAIKSAADPTAYTEHMTACNLEPWTVKKARSVCQGKTQGNLTIDAARFCSSLGRPVAEIAGKARAILSGSEQTRDATNFQTLFCAAQTKFGDRTFFDGLELPYGCDARRAKQDELAAQGEALAARAGDRRQKLGVVNALSDGTDKKTALLLAQLRSNIDGVDPEFAVEYLSSAGRRFAESGNLTAAEEAYSLVAAELPDEPGAREAFAWLAQFYSGGEPARRVQLQGAETLNQSPIERFLQAGKLGDAIRDAAPDAFMAPEIRFPLAAAQAGRGDLEGAMRFYLMRSQASGDDVWGVRAAAEYWLRAPKGDMRSEENKYCPLGLFSCRRILEKPYLDGAPEQNVWANAQKLDLSAPYNEAPQTREPTVAEKNAKLWREKNRAFTKKIGSEVMFGYDSEYLYIAATCQKADGFVYPSRDAGSSATLTDALNAVSGQGGTAAKNKPPRNRDDDLGAYDRVEIQIDLDGDYTTAYKFVFDCRGWLYDSNWNDPNWNPRVFVAQSETGSSWTVEAAIPLAEITERPPEQGGVWRVAVRRVTPGVGVECWNVENSQKGDGAFGLMFFEN